MPTNKSKSSGDLLRLPPPEDYSIHLADPYTARDDDFNRDQLSVTLAPLSSTETLPKNDRVKLVTGQAGNTYPKP